MGSSSSKIVQPNSNNCNECLKNILSFEMKAKNGNIRFMKGKKYKLNYINNGTPVFYYIGDFKDLNNNGNKLQFDNVITYSYNPNLNTHIQSNSPPTTTELSIEAIQSQYDVTEIFNGGKRKHKSLKKSKKNKSFKKI